MKSKEYFQGGTGWAAYPLKGSGSIPADEHPLSQSESHDLPAGTTHFQVYTYLGDSTKVPTIPGQRPLWEQLIPANNVVGPVLSPEEYNEVLISVDADFQAGAVPLAPAEGEWVSERQEPVIYSSTLHVVTGIELPRDIDDHQLKATTVFQRNAPNNVPSYAGTVYTDNLQARGFPPDSFWHLAEDARLMHGSATMAHGLSATLGVMGNLPAAKVSESLVQGAQEIVKGMIPQGKLKEVIRTSRHSQRT